MDRKDFYFKQRVSEAELDAAFAYAESAIWNLTVDLEASGITSGIEASENSPADLQVQVSAGVGYDDTGGRVYLPTGELVDCSQDYTGVPSEPTIGGNERWLSLFILRTVVESDPRLDGNNNTVYFDQAESAEIMVRMGAEAGAGLATKVALRAGELLICDVLRTAGQTQIFDADIYVDRRQILQFLGADNIPVDGSSWVEIDSSAANIQEALDSVDTQLAGHFGGTADKHDADHIVVDDGSFTQLSGTDGQTVFDSVDTELAGHFGGTADKHDADHIVVDDGSFNEINGTDGQTVFDSIDSWLDGHRTGVSERHNTASIDGSAQSGSPFDIAAETLELQLQHLLADLNTQHNSMFGAEHTTTSDPNGSGYHRNIIFDQPNEVTTNKFQLWETGPDVGSASPQVYARCYYNQADNSNPTEPEGLVFTINAKWIASTWTYDDSTKNASALSLQNSQLVVWQREQGGGNWTAWDTRCRVRLPYPGGVTGSSHWEVTAASDVVEKGNCGLCARNQSGAPATVFDSNSANFKGAFDAAPSTVTVSIVSQLNWSGTPSVAHITPLGFRLYGTTTTIADNNYGWVHGEYSAG